MPKMSVKTHYTIVSSQGKEYPTPADFALDEARNNFYSKFRDTFPNVFNEQTLYAIMRILILDEKALLLCNNLVEDYLVNLRAAEKVLREQEKRHVEE